MRILAHFISSTKPHSGCLIRNQRAGTDKCDPSRYARLIARARCNRSNRRHASYASAHLTREYTVIVNLVSLTPIYLNGTLD